MYFEKMFCLLGVCIATTMSKAENSISSKGIAMKTSGNLPGCTNGHITYTVDTNVNPSLKTSVFRITEAISTDECAHLCYTHYFCRSAGFEPNNRVDSGGLCYLSYKESRNCLESDVSSQRVTDYQTTEQVWVDCDLCMDPIPSPPLKFIPVIDDEFKDGKNEIENEKYETVSTDSVTNSTNSTEIVPFPEILPSAEFNNRTEEGSGAD